MAGAGKRTFIAGEVLTAAQVNDYLMDQAVMRFSGSAARAASITAPTEGMVTYLDDVNRVEYYDGAAWTPISPTDVVRDSDFTEKGQILVASANAAPIPVSIGTEGQVLTAASAQTAGVQWVTPSGAGAAIYKNIAATGVTALPAALTPGFYRISTGNTTSWTQTEFRFVDEYGDLYGASVTSGVGFATIPRTVASVNITTNAGFNLLVEEIPGVTSTLPSPPTVTAFGWVDLQSGSITFTTASTPTRVGYFNPVTGSLVTSSVVTSPFSSAIVTASTTAVGSDARFTFLTQNADGLWSISGSAWSASAFNAPYPFQIFTSNGTYVPPSWSASADVFILSGGGAGGGAAAATTSGVRVGGGGGAGGASLFTNVATPGSVAVTVGTGGTGGTGTGPNGSTSSFGARSTSGGGGGGAAANGSAGGSGGGGGGSKAPGGNVNGTGGTATAGQGNNGGNANVPGGTPANGGGGGGAGGVGGNATTVITGAGGTGTTYLGIQYGGGGSGGGTDPIGTATFGGGSGGQSIAFGPGTPGPGSAATANTGGGGGGAAVWDETSPFNAAAAAGGNGGSGFVIVRAR